MNLHGRLAAVISALFLFAAFINHHQQNTIDYNGRSILKSVRVLKDLLSFKLEVAGYKAGKDNQIETLRKVLLAEKYNPYLCRAASREGSPYDGEAAIDYIVKTEQTSRSVTMRGLEAVGGDGGVNNHVMIPWTVYNHDTLVQWLNLPAQEALYDRWIQNKSNGEKLVKFSHDGYEVQI